jgi:hypothetical protein
MDDPLDVSIQMMGLASLNLRLIIRQFPFHSAKRVPYCILKAPPCKVYNILHQTWRTRIRTRSKNFQRKLSKALELLNLILCEFPSCGRASGSITFWHGVTPRKVIEERMCAKPTQREALSMDGERE